MVRPIDSDDESPSDISGSGEGPQKGEPQPHELRLTLREPTAEELLGCASEAAGRAPVPATAPPERLGDAAVQDLFKLMEAGGAPTLLEETDAQDFAMRAPSLKPPRPGQVVEQPFPVPGADEGSLLGEAARLHAEATRAAGALQVLRSGPQGDVQVVPLITITFNQPMIPLSTVEDSIEDSTAVAPIGVVMTPASAATGGRWRWAGTQTLLFEPGYRLPSATEYTVTVPVGVTSSATGSAMAEAHSFSFRTPPPRMQRSHPYGGHSRPRPVLFVEFDQDMPESEELVKHLQLEQPGMVRSTRLALEVLKTREAILEGVKENDDRHRQDFCALTGLLESAVPKRHLFLRPAAPLPLNTGFKLEVAAGTPSAEGPRRTETAQSFSFRTYPPLELSDTFPFNRKMTPCASFGLRFSNELDLEAVCSSTRRLAARKVFDVDSIRVTPEVSGLTVVPGGSSVTLRGCTKGGTTYRVRVAKGALTDIYGQTLAKDVDSSFTVGPAAQSLCSLHSGLEIFDPLPAAKLGAGSLPPPTSQDPAARGRPEGPGTALLPVPRGAAEYVGTMEHKEGQIELQLLVECTSERTWGGEVSASGRRERVQITVSTKPDGHEVRVEGQSFTLEGKVTGDGTIGGQVAAGGSFTLRPREVERLDVTDTDGDKLTWVLIEASAEDKSLHLAEFVNGRLELFVTRIHVEQGTKFHDTTGSFTLPAAERAAASARLRELVGRAGGQWTESDGPPAAPAAPPAEDPVAKKPTSLMSRFTSMLCVSKPQAGGVDAPIPLVPAGLSPAQRACIPKFSFVTVNVKRVRVAIYKVDPLKDYMPYLAWQAKLYDLKKRGQLGGIDFGKCAVDVLLDIRAAADESTRTDIDLRPYLKDVSTNFMGQLMIVVEPALGHWKDETWQYRPVCITWLQVTHLAADFFSVDTADVYSLCTSMLDGAPLAGVDVHVLGVGGSSNHVGASSTSGLCRIPSECVKRHHQMHVVVSASADVVLLPDIYVNECLVHTNNTVIFTFDDRKMYKPKERVTVKGVVRVMRPVHAGRAWDLQMPSPSMRTATWEARDSRGVDFAKGSVDVSEHGGFRLEVELPDTVNCGTNTIVFTVAGTRHQHTFEVQEFRRPECKVSASVRSTQPVVVGGTGVAGVVAKYYAGNAGISGADTTWAVSQKQGHFTPPSWTGKGFSFMTSPDSGNTRGYMLFEPGLLCTGSWEHKCSTDGAGEHLLAVQCERGVVLNGPMSVELEATVVDINRQSRTSSCRFLVHPSSLCVGLKCPLRFLRLGKQLLVEVVVTDLRGEQVEAEVVLRLRNTWYERKGWSTVKQVDLVSMNTVMCRATGAVEVPVKPEFGGWHTLEAQVVDAEGRSSFSDARFFVAGGAKGVKAATTRQGSNIQSDELQLLLPPEPPRPGDKVEVTVQAPFGPATGVLCACAKGAVATLPFSVSADGTAVVEVQVEKWHIPQLALQAVVSGTCPREEPGGSSGAAAAAVAAPPPRPSYALGSATLSLPPECKRLSVQVQPSVAVLAPGGDLTIAVEVRSETGPESDVEVTLVVVDESVLSLTDYNVPNPLDVFFELGLFNCSSPSWRHSRSLVFAENWDQVQVDEKPVEVVKQRHSLEGRMFGGGVVKRKCRAAAPRGIGSRMEVDEECMDMMMDDDECEMMERCAMPQMAMAMAMPQSMAMDAGAEAEDSGAELDKEAEEEEAPPEEAGPTEVKTRSNFDALAAFVDVKTDSAGKVVVPCTLPDNLTAYRIWAVCHKGAELYGLGEAAIEAVLPLMVRPSLPRFLNFGDVAELAVVVQNSSASHFNVRLACRTNAPVLQLRQGADAPAAPRAGLRLSLPPGGRQEARFLAAAMSAGTARVQICGLVEGTKHSDAASLEVPVWTPATTEAFATYGHLDGSNLTDPRVALAQPLKPPADCFPQFGGLQVAVSSTILHTISDAFLYLYSYPFECCEQVSSKCLAVLALYDCLHAFAQGPGSTNASSIPSSPVMKSWLAEQLQRMEKWQLPSGGFGWWMMVIPQTQPWLTVHATNVLVRARAKGVKVSDTMLERALQCCAKIEKYFEAFTPESCRVALLAKALMVRALAGREKKEKLQAECAEVLKRMGGPDGKHSSLETVAFLLMAAHLCNASAQVGPLLKHINNLAHETAETATFPTSYGDDHAAKLIMIHSDRRTDAIVLMALVMASPDSPLVIKAMKGLFAHQKKGRWNNTQENVWALLAIDSYFQAFEKVAPDFEAKVMLMRSVADKDLAEWTVPSAVLALQHTFKGHSAERVEALVPMSYLKEHKEDSGDAVAIVARQKPGGAQDDPGTGRLYYRLGLTYAPTDLRLGPLNVGFEVLRKYTAISDPDDVKLVDGVWRVKAGCLVKVTLNMTTVARRYHVALVDKLPAGFEAVNPELKGMSTKEGRKAAGGSHTGGHWWWSMPWFEHQNLRDERVEAFASLLSPGHHRYSYTARATSLGEFVAPPAKAEEMYSPEIFGRSGTAHVVVVAA